MRINLYTKKRKMKTVASSNVLLKIIKSPSHKCLELVGLPHGGLSPPLLSLVELRWINFSAMDHARNLLPPFLHTASNQNWTGRSGNKARYQVLTCFLNTSYLMQVTIPGRVCRISRHGWMPLVVVQLEAIHWLRKLMVRAFMAYTTACCNGNIFPSWELCNPFPHGTQSA